MQRPKIPTLVVIALTALALTLTGVVSAQATQPAVPLGPHANQAMVRFVHTSPNADPDQVVLSNGAQSVALEEFAGLRYLEATEYIPVLAGSYDLVVRATSDDVEAQLATPAHRLDLVGGQYYTVALTGLALPPETTGVGEGFLAWLEDLFTTERHDLQLRTIAFDDMTGMAIAPNEAEVRIVHTAPGTAAIDLVHTWNGTVDVLETVAYGEVSLFSRIVPTTGRLEARVAGTEAVLVDLTEVAQEPGMVHSLFVTGTPVEDVPIQGLALSTPWTAAQALPPGTPGAVAPAAGMITVNEVAWVRDHLIQVEAWLDTIEQRLTTTMADPAVTEEQVAAALEEVEHAMVLLAEARAQLDMVVVPPAGAPAAEPADPAN